jgi:hypothetical protein
MPAEEFQETDKGPVNASLITMLLLTFAYVGASVGWLLTTNARRQQATCCSVADDGVWLGVAHEGPSSLEVFRL